MRGELQPEWMPGWAFDLLARGAGVVIVLTLWPLIAVAGVADLLCEIDPRYEDF